MNHRATRSESRRDREAIAWARELRETEKWFRSRRFRHITRLHTPYDVVALRGSMQGDHTVAKHAAAKLYDTLQRLFDERKESGFFIWAAGQLRRRVRSLRIRARIWPIMPWIAFPKRAERGCARCCTKTKFKDRIACE
ncbi:MAG: hypothetical protein HYV04_14230 [Deltaproteobacteria bacterium]|nr:hypothetical protein [Deltaproteobacteria bacterium]